MIPAFIAAQALKKRNDEPVHMYATHVISVTKKKKPQKKERAVINAKGGGGPKMPSPEEEARAQMLLEQEKARLAEEKAKKEAEQKEKERLARVEKAKVARTQAENYARGYDNTELANRGISDALNAKYGISSSYDSALERALMGLGEEDANPLASMSTKTWLDDAINSAQGRYRSDLTRGVNSVAGDGFEYNTFADTSDDAILEEILGKQKADALSQIDAAFARGQLNEAGYGRAKSGLETAATAGLADLQTLGQGVLSGYRKDLTTMRDNQLNKIGNITFSDSYDPDAFANLLTGRTNDMKNRMSGDLYKAVGSKAYFDPSTLISQAGSLQGYFNPTTNNTKVSTSADGGANPLLAAFAEDEKKKQQTAGSGNTLTNGVF